MVRERSDPVASEPEALRAWRSGACGARRPAQTAPNRGKAPAQGRRHLGQGMGAGAMSHTSIETVPGRVRMPLAHAARMALAQFAMAPTTRAGPRTAASRDAKGSGYNAVRPTGAPGSSCCAGRGGPSRTPTLEVLVAR